MRAENIEFIEPEDDSKDEWDDKWEIEWCDS